MTLLRDNLISPCLGGPKTRSEVSGLLDSLVACCFSGGKASREVGDLSFASGGRGSRLISRCFRFGHVAAHLTEFGFTAGDLLNSLVACCFSGGKAIDQFAPTRLALLCGLSSLVLDHPEGFLSRLLPARLLGQVGTQGINFGTTSQQFGTQVLTFRRDHFFGARLLRELLSKKSVSRLEVRSLVTPARIHLAGLLLPSPDLLGGDGRRGLQFADDLQCRTDASAQLPSGLCGGPEFGLAFEVNFALTFECRLRLGDTT
ncbi:hypothetical protein GOFOIKOB_6354 [Methylobacterium tardum]|nr:hypothetical protein GOFOIKOB_6354 [Methylobacterium tardum]